MKLNLTRNEQEKLIKILDYFINVPRKLWKNHYKLLEKIKSILKKLDESSLINLKPEEEKALIEILEFAVYSPFPHWKHGNITEYENVAETVLFKKIKHPRFNLITLQFEVYNENTNRFESTQNNTTK